MKYKWKVILLGKKFQQKIILKTIKNHGLLNDIVSAQCLLTDRETNLAIGPWQRWQNLYPAAAARKRPQSWKHAYSWSEYRVIRVQAVPDDVLGCGRASD